MSEEFHVSSLVVFTGPQNIESVTEALNCLPGVEVHGANPTGKLVVTLESEGRGQIVKTVDKIDALEGVISTSLIYHQFDETLPEYSH